jgi:hypothetical protein
MKIVFADTGYWIAILDPQDTLHKKAIDRSTKPHMKQLLEIAKTGVEKAIETNEESAIAWIKQQLEELRIEL